MLKNKKWFTVVELIFVITIITVIWSISMISLNWIEAKAKISAEKINLWNISSALNTYFLQYDRYPSNNYIN